MTYDDVIVVKFHFSSLPGVQNDVTTPDKFEDQTKIFIAISKAYG